MNDEHVLHADQIKPNDDVSIIDLTADPYPDKRRVKVYFRLSFFQQPPNAAISLYGKGDEPLAYVNIVSIFNPENEVTLHIPGSRVQKGAYRVVLTLFDLKEREAREDEKGEVRLETQKLGSETINFIIT